MPILRRVLLSALLCALPACTGPDYVGGDPGGGDLKPPANRRTDWTNGAVIYELFVRSFQDSDGDGKGDLRGLIARLDYLNDGKPETTTDLGVDAIWLMPVFASPSYHGYDVTDYERINPDYGTNDDFQQLCAEAHKRGMKVILDFVVNHTSTQHPWFVESAGSSGSARRNWYVWNPTNPGWTQPWGGTSPTWHPYNGAYYYGVFWGGMPDLNLRTPAVREEIKRLAALWLARGADGFRLDAARYIIENGAQQAQDTPETHVFWKEFAASVRAVRSDALLVGEVWASTSIISAYHGSTATVPGGDELPLTFDFPLATEIIKGINSGEATGIAGQLKVVQLVYAPGITNAPFLTNHDHTRVATQLGNNVGKARNAAAILLTVPGTAFVYYGEEVGMQNGSATHDEAKRTPMAWDSSLNGGFTTGTPWYQFSSGKQTNNVASQTNDPGSLLSRYRKLIRARRSSPALTRGGLELLTPTTGSSSTLAFVRWEDDERVLVVHNLTDNAVTAGPYAVSRSSAEPLFLDDSASLTGGQGAWRVSLPPRGTGIWRMR